MTIAALLGATSLAACHTTAAPSSGYLSAYDGMEKAGRTPGIALNQRRDDVASDSVHSVYLEAAVFAPQVGDNLSDHERAMVLSEVDRQICFEVSERFVIAPTQDLNTATIRTAIVRAQPTGRIGSVVSAAAGFFVPVVSLRPPMTTGGLAVESELLEAGTGRQIAAIAWARNAQYVGRDSGSLSRVGDALQMAEPMGDAVGDAFSSETREVKDIPDPDPCAEFGPRRDVGRTAAGFVFGAATGLYSPEASGNGARQRSPEP
ncbi:hypothetical protein BZG35_16465 [Brevundimonas sp. LM2]|uniref:DUF3313 family protein n=1 Tax=Brevundimonas sp. LM2 TaxID=1938605 RepID=UPI00098399AD|nr:DUF3313 family protein [Brevundimonas sp. LM2]AQR63072.1 hypothetical protein BZG35_16465 [Brevundimonas sp. LM2]